MEIARPRDGVTPVYNSGRSRTSAYNTIPTRTVVVENLLFGLDNCGSAVRDDDNNKIPTLDKK